MPNPYETPPIVPPPERRGAPIWRRAAGAICMLVSSFATLYGAVLCVLSVMAIGGQLRGPLPPALFIFLSVLIFVFGVGLGVCGYGIWTARRSPARRGGAAVGLSILGYIGAVIAFN